MKYAATLTALGFALGAVSGPIAKRSFEDVVAAIESIEPVADALTSAVEYYSSVDEDSLVLDPCNAFSNTLDDIADTLNGMDALEQSEQGGIQRYLSWVGRVGYRDCMAAIIEKKPDFVEGGIAVEVKGCLNNILAGTDGLVEAMVHVAPSQESIIRVTMPTQVYNRHLQPALDAFADIDDPEPPVTTSNAPGPTDTDTPGSTDTDSPDPTDTNTPGPTGTSSPGPTDTNTPDPTDTETPDPTDTETPGPTGTKTESSTGPTDTETTEPTVTDRPCNAITVTVSGCSHEPTSTGNPPDDDDDDGDNDGDDDNGWDDGGWDWDNGDDDDRGDNGDDGWDWDDRDDGDDDDDGGWDWDGRDDGGDDISPPDFDGSGSLNKVSVAGIVIALGAGLAL